LAALKPDLVVTEKVRREREREREKERERERDLERGEE
jgi:hypothetical protein